MRFGDLTFETLNLKKGQERREERGLNTWTGMEGLLVGGKRRGVGQMGTFVRGQKMLTCALI